MVVQHEKPEFSPTVHLAACICWASSLTILLLHGRMPLMSSTVRFRLHLNRRGYKCLSTYQIYSSPGFSCF